MRRKGDGGKERLEIIVEGEGKGKEALNRSPTQKVFINENSVFLVGLKVDVCV